MSRPPEQAGALLTAQEVADIFGVHKVSVYRWASDGTLDPVRIGGVVRFRRADVDAKVNGHVLPHHEEAS